MLRGSTLPYTPTSTGIYLNEEKAKDQFNRFTASKIDNLLPLSTFAVTNMLVRITLDSVCAYLFVDQVRGKTYDPENIIIKIRERSY